MTDENDPGKKFTERRGHSRHKVSKDVRIEVDGEVVTCTTNDISLCGVAVKSLVDFTTEQFVKLHLEKIGELTGEVVRQFDDGFAIEFDTVEDNGSVLEDKLRTLMGTDKKVKQTDNAVDEVANERARMEAQLAAMMGGDDDD